MSAVDTNFYQKKKNKTFYIAIVFFVFVVLLSGVLYFYQNKIKEENLQLTSNIAQKTHSIKELENEDAVQIYSIYDRHRNLFEQISRRSKVPTFVNHLKKQFARYGLDSKDFDYSNGSIKIDISSQTNDSGYAYQKVVKFLNEYEKDEKALFDVKSITNFNGYDRINFTPEFLLK